MSNTSPASPGFLVDLAKSLSAGVAFVVSGCWKWVPLSTIAVFLLALGISAMYATQYILAAGLYFVGIALLTGRFAADARSHARRGGVLFVIILVGVLVFVGSLWLLKHTYETQGHNDNILSAAVSSAALIGWAYISDAWRLPWRWMLTSLAVGFVLASMLHVLRSQAQRKDDIATNADVDGSVKYSECQDDWLHEKLKTDKATIWDLVWVASIFYRPDFDKSQPRIDFVFNVMNNSLLDVLISMEGGYILFSDDNEQFYFEPKFIGPDPVRCNSRDTKNFTIRQAVTGDEIKKHFKSTDNTRISFGNLSVSFRGTEQFSEITPTRLDVNHYLFTAEHAWHNPNRPKFLSEQQSVPSVEAERANLVFKGIGKLHAYSLHGYPLQEGNAPDSLSTSSYQVLALTVRVENEFSDLFKTIPVPGVTAKLLYSTHKGELFQLNRGAWLGSANRANFLVNDLRDLVIATVMGEGDERFVYAIHREYRDDQGFEKVGIVLSEDVYYVKVRIISEDQGLLHFEKQFVLNVQETPKFRVSLQPLDEENANSE